LHDAVRALDLLILGRGDFGIDHWRFYLGLSFPRLDIVRLGAADSTQALDRRRAVC
jgi:hypothetical protein